MRLASIVAATVGLVAPLKTPSKRPRNHYMTASALLASWDWWFADYFHNALPKTEARQSYSDSSASCPIDQCNS
jgi:hypothetical protein